MNSVKNALVAALIVTLVSAGFAAASATAADPKAAGNGPATATKGGDPPRLSVLQFNMCGNYIHPNPAKCPSHGWTETPTVDAIVDSILDENNRFKTDVVSLNEVCFDQGAAIMKKLEARAGTTEPDWYFWAGLVRNLSDTNIYKTADLDDPTEPRLHGDCRRFGNAIISKKPVSHHQAIRLYKENDHYVDGIAGHMICVRTTPIPTTIRVCSTHLQPGNTERDRDIRDGQTLAAMRTLNGWTKMPTVLMGDFNAEPGDPEMSWVYTNNLYGFKDAQSLYARCANSLDPPQPCPSNWHTGSVYDPGGPSRKIDYVFFSQSFTNPNGSNSYPKKYSPNYYVSDHKLLRGYANR